jgi:hypothetical protein
VVTSKYQVVYWRDIPAQVKARSNAVRSARQFSARFQEAIDAAAMISGAVGTDEYLAAWRTSDWQTGEGDVERLLDEIVARFEREYTEERLSELLRAGGYAAAG